MTKHTPVRATSSSRITRSIGCNDTVHDTRPLILLQHPTKKTIICNRNAIIIPKGSVLPDGTVSTVRLFMFWRNDKQYFMKAHDVLAIILQNSEMYDHKTIIKNKPANFSVKKITAALILQQLSSPLSISGDIVLSGLSKILECVQEADALKKQQTIAAEALITLSCTN